jgi:hypothetical protein
MLGGAIGIEVPYQGPQNKQEKVIFTIYIYNLKKRDIIRYT